MITLTENEVALVQSILAEYMSTYENDWNRQEYVPAEVAAQILAAVALQCRLSECSLPRP